MDCMAGWIGLILQPSRKKNQKPPVKKQNQKNMVRIIFWEEQKLQRNAFTPSRLFYYEMFQPEVVQNLPQSNSPPTHHVLR